MTRWLDVKADVDLAYDLFEVQRDQLLRLVPENRFMTLLANEVLDLERSASKPPKKQSKKQSKRSSEGPRPRIANLLMRLLQRKLASLMGRKTGATPSRAKPVRPSPPEGRNENHQSQDP